MLAVVLRVAALIAIDGGSSGGGCNRNRSNQQDRLTGVGTRRQAGPTSPILAAVSTSRVSNQFADNYLSTNGVLIRQYTVDGNAVQLCPSTEAEQLDQNRYSGNSRSEIRNQLSARD